MTKERKRLLVALAATAVVLLPLAWFWQQSLMPSTYSVMDMGYVDYGVGPAAAEPAHHGGHHVGGTSVRDLVADPQRAADVTVDLVARQGKTKLAGVDIEGRLRNKLGEWGSLSSTLRSTYVDTYKIQEREGDFMHNLTGTYPYYSDWHIGTGDPMPRWKTSISTTWTRADHAVNLSLNYVGPVSLLRRYDNEKTYAEPFCAFGTRMPTDAAPGCASCARWPRVSR